MLNTLLKIFYPNSNMKFNIIKYNRNNFIKINIQNIYVKARIIDCISCSS